MLDRLPPTTFHRPFRTGGASKSSPPLLALLALASLPAAAAPGSQRNYGVNGFDRVRVDGPYEVRLKTNVAPFARASGSPSALDGLSIKVEGRTLVVRPSGGSWGGYPGENRGPVTVEIGTHDLTAAWLNGAGTLTIDRVRGLSFDLALQGSGSTRIDQADIDQMKVGLSGSGVARIAGRAARLSTTVRGSSTLDADGLSIKDAVIGAEGPSTVRASVSETAKVDAAGLAAITLRGKPACIVKAQGSANVVGCRTRQ